MITIELRGGLGNQLFQYALGRFLEIHNKVAIRYDTSKLWSDYTKRNCELSLFQTRWRFGDFPILPEQKIIHERKRYSIVCDRIGINTHRYNYQTHVQQSAWDLYMQGFWQSYKYFEAIKNILISELQPREILDMQNLDIINRMQSENAVSVHIRRGDFQKVTLSGIHIAGKHWHTIVPLSYYHNAMALIRKQVANPVFYIFSNDPDRCKKQFVWDHYRFVTHNTGANNYKDMILMSHCKHNIICNSTFSWWGAYLNQYIKSIIIAPKKWYNVAIDTKDLLLPGRHKI